MRERRAQIASSVDSSTVIDEVAAGALREEIRLAIATALQSEQVVDAVLEAIRDRLATTGLASLADSMADPATCLSGSLGPTPIAVSSAFASRLAQERIRGREQARRMLMPDYSPKRARAGSKSK